MRRQMAALTGIWMAIGVVALLVNLHVGISAALLLISTVLFGAAATTSTGVLFTQRKLRPILAAAYADFESPVKVPGVDVYEQSEIGRLQRGFNRIVAGLRERDQLRELFGRHVGVDVVRRAVAEDESLEGDVRDVAVLFIDLVGSTEFASTHPPQEVADALNDFFRIVVAAVDERDGLINKFQGDAALAVFGAPLRIDNPASDALATGRSLATKFDRLPPLDFGIGVSAGPVFAGNIGAENRYEYTVIGDAVNEAARLADVAKSEHGRILCSGSAIERADARERRHWASRGSVVLRGRSVATAISAPIDI